MNSLSLVVLRLAVVLQGVLAVLGPGTVRAGTAFYVSQDRWHTGIVVARADLPAEAWPPGVLTRDFAGCRSLEIGWGDRAYYMATHPTVFTALSAALVPGRSALHIAGFKEKSSAVRTWDRLITVPCTRAQLAALGRALADSFALGPAGQAEKLGTGLYGDRSQFYAARGRYWIGNTCNSWTLRQERAGGLPTRIGPAGTLSSEAVAAQTRRLCQKEKW